MADYLAFYEKKCMFQKAQNEFVCMAGCVYVYV